jgi:hypothetical protein
MAAPTLSAVTALSNKALELERKSHFARAAEKCADAVAVAQALTQAHESCLIVAKLQLRQFSLLHSQAFALDVLPEERARRFVAALDEMQRLLCAAFAVVKRRGAAGTLLEGCCRPREVAFAAAYHAHVCATATLEHGPPPSAADGARCAWPALLFTCRILAVSNGRAGTDAGGMR